MSAAALKPKCACCGGVLPWGVKFTIHRDGFGEGPEVPLCRKCGEKETPTCEEIWARIAERQRSAK